MTEINCNIVVCSNDKASKNEKKISSFFTFLYDQKIKPTFGSFFSKLAMPLSRLDTQTNYAITIDLKNTEPDIGYDHEVFTNLLSQVKKKKLENLKSNLINPDSDNAFLEFVDNAINEIELFSIHVEQNEELLMDLINTLHSIVKSRRYAAKFIVQKKQIDAFRQHLKTLLDMMKKGNFKHLVSQDKLLVKFRDKFNEDWKNKKERVELKNLSKEDLQKAKNSFFKESLLQFNTPVSDLQEPLFLLCHAMKKLIKSSVNRNTKISATEFIHNMLHDNKDGLLSLKNKVSPNRTIDIEPEDILSHLRNNAKNIGAFYQTVNSNELVSTLDYQKLLQAVNSIIYDLNHFKNLELIPIPKTLTEIYDLDPNILISIDRAFNNVSDITIKDLEQYVTTLLKSVKRTLDVFGCTKDDKQIEKDRITIEALHIFQVFLSKHNTIDIELLSKQIKQLCHPVQAMTNSDRLVINEQVKELEKALSDLENYVERHILH